MSFDVISDISQAVLAVSIVEIHCLLVGEFSISDFRYDDDQLVASYIESIDDPVERDNLEHEYTEALTQAQELVMSTVRRELVSRRDLLGDEYPFLLDETGELMLLAKDRRSLGPVSWCYLWLTLYKVSANSDELLLISTSDRSRFNALFAKVFEIIGCFALAGREQSPVWYFGRSRSVRTLIEHLNSVAGFLPGARLKAVADLQDHQRHRNDLGVDVLSIKIFAGQFRHDSHMVLLGATIQKEQLRNKIMGAPEIGAFLGFFLNIPPVPIQTALAVPHDFSRNLQLNCAEQNCIYIHFEDILMHIASGVGLVTAVGGLDRVGARLRALTRRVMPQLQLVA